MPFLPKGFEWVIILVVVLLIFGPKNLPKLGKALGKTVSNLRSGMNEGKKKDEPAEDGSSEEVADTPTAQPAELEGEVESIEDVSDESAVVDKDATSNEGATSDEAPKKVKRVVKKVPTKD